MDHLTTIEEPTFIRVEGVLDVPAAQRLALRLADAGDEIIHVDLTRVREFHDLGVALLARSLSGRRGISLSGLRQHHLRLLRYLGLDPAPNALDDARELA